ncbi:uncharacterized protein LOC143423746 [Xylocopa sonorina]|uniref:uncharacterized protein LOC143423746 n=1 Tax=Xylocopa sonorina TaxID=1818115 RepID=UPI00403AC1E3
MQKQKEIEVIHSLRSNAIKTQQSYVRIERNGLLQSKQVNLAKEDNKKGFEGDFPRLAFTHSTGRKRWIVFTQWKVLATVIVRRVYLAEIARNWSGWRADKDPRG